MRHACGVTSVAEYLRTRREQLQPADVGLPDSGRRRTPGLRREEVATLAGISIDYLVRLEQGRRHPTVSERDRRPSPMLCASTTTNTDSSRCWPGSAKARSCVRRRGR